MSPGQQYSKRKKGFFKNTQFKLFFFLFACGAVVGSFFTGWIFFTAPYSTESNHQQILPLFRKNPQKSNNNVAPSEKEDRDKIAFTFFETLSRPEKKPALKKNREKQTPLKSLNNEKLSHSAPKPGGNNTPGIPKSNKSSNFFIQVGSFKDNLRAEDLKKRLGKKGYETFIMAVEIPNKGLWSRVFLERGFADKESALKIIDKIKFEEKVSAFLKSSPIRE